VLEQSENTFTVPLPIGEAWRPDLRGQGQASATDTVLAVDGSKGLNHLVTEVEQFREL